MKAHAHTDSNTHTDTLILRIKFYTHTIAFVSSTYYVTSLTEKHAWLHLAKKNKKTNKHSLPRLTTNVSTVAQEEALGSIERG